jgi:hypothetical protein
LPASSPPPLEVLPLVPPLVLLPLVPPLVLPLVPPLVLLPLAPPLVLLFEPGLGFDSSEEQLAATSPGERDDGRDGECDQSLVAHQRPPHEARP